MADRSRTTPAGSGQDDHLAESYPISVVIPAYNAVPYLARCLGALQQNDLREVEVILADDGSTDSPDAWLREAGWDRWVQIVRSEVRGGPAAARNRGSAVARHPYLFFLDADIVLPPDSVRRIRETLDLYSHRADVAGVLGGYAERIGARDFLTNFKNLSTCFLYQITATQSPYLHTPIFLVRRSVLEAVGGFDAGLRKAEDFRLGLALGSRGYRFIIDRHIKGEHLKRYRLAGTIRENWERILSLRSIRLTAEERAFSYRAHRWTRLLAILLPAPLLAAAGAALIGPVPAWPAWVLAGLFTLLNLRFLLYLRKWQGTFFALRALAFCFVEMLFGQLALAASLVYRPRSSGAVPSHGD